MCVHVCVRARMRITTCGVTIIALGNGFDGPNSNPRCGS